MTERLCVDNLIMITPLQYLKWYLSNKDSVAKLTFYESIEHYFMDTGCDKADVDCEWMYIHAGVQDVGIDTPVWIKELGDMLDRPMINTDEVILKVAEQIGHYAVDAWRAELDYNDW